MIWIRARRERAVAALQEAKRRAARDRVTLAAAGLAFHGFLAIFPALVAAAAVTALAGLPKSALAATVHSANVVLPAPVSALLIEALQAPRSADFAAGAVGVALALWSSVEGVAALLQALAAIERPVEPRGFVARRVEALPLLAATALLGLVAAAIVVLGGTLSRDATLRFGGVAGAAVDVARLFAAGALIAALIALYYRAQFRKVQRRRLVSPGSLLATFGWLAASAGYSFYLGAKAGGSSAYGPLAGVAATLLWLYITFLAILLGAEIDIALAAQLSQAAKRPGRQVPLQISEEDGDHDQDRAKRGADAGDRRDHVGRAGEILGRGLDDKAEAPPGGDSHRRLPGDDEESG